MTTTAIPTIPTIVGLGPAAYYASPVGFFAGSAGPFSAMVNCALPTAAPAYTSNTISIAGNYNYLTHKGWRIYRTAVGYLAIDIGNGTHNTTAIAPFVLSQGKFLQLLLDVTVSGGVATAVLYINGTQAVLMDDVDGGLFAPNPTGVMSLGYGVNNGLSSFLPFPGGIFGFAYANSGGAGPVAATIFQQTLSGNGSLAPAGTYSLEAFFNVGYRTRFSNDGATAAAHWSPYGTVTTPNLTLTGSAQITALGLGWA